VVKNIVFSFIALFFALDPLGVLPIFINFTKNLNEKEKYRVIQQSVFTALGITVFFVFAGRYIFKFLGIKVEDFYIGGGAVLFILAIRDILIYKDNTEVWGDDLGVVPLGTPLLAGPCVLTLSLVLLPRFGLGVVILSLVLNLALAGIIFYFSQFFLNLLGKRGTRAISKITSLLLVAVAVMLIRKGLVSFLS